MVKVIKTADELATLEKESGNKLIVIDFYATWCGPCKMIAPILEKIAEENKDKLVLVKVDVDESEDLTKAHNINVMPTFIFKKNGENVDSLEGASEAKLRDMIKKHL